MDGIALMATAMRAAQERLDVSAANLANVSSNGFHKRLIRARLTAGGLQTETSLDPAQGPLRRTGRAFDLAVAGAGTFSVREHDGRVAAERSGSFFRDAAGHLNDERGRTLLGRHGALAVGAGATIDPSGVVHDGGAVGGRIEMSVGASLASGFLEGSNVDAVHEMIDVLDAQRAFETAQKALGAIDETRNKDANDVARVRS
jgi:flagellar basal body rod protein FlgG